MFTKTTTMILENLGLFIFLGLLLVSHFFVQIAALVLEGVDNLSEKDKANLGFGVHLVKGLMYAIILGSFILVVLSIYPLLIK